MIVGDDQTPRLYAKYRSRNRTITRSRRKPAADLLPPNVASLETQSMLFAAGIASRLSGACRGVVTVNVNVRCKAWLGGLSQALFRREMSPPTAPPDAPPVPPPPSAARLATCAAQGAVAAIAAARPAAAIVSTSPASGRVACCEPRLLVVRQLTQRSSPSCRPIRLHQPGGAPYPRHHARVFDVRRVRASPAARQEE